MNLKLRIRKINGIPVLYADGHIDNDGIAHITKKLDHLIKSKNPKIGVNLSNTTFIDSHGLGVLIYYWRILKSDNRDLIIINPQGFVQSLFQGTNLNNIFKIVESESNL